MREDIALFASWAVAIVFLLAGLAPRRAAASDKPAAHSDPLGKRR